MAPKFYVTNFEKVCERIRSLEKGKTWEIGRSAGDLPILVVSYGEVEQREVTSHRIAALFAGVPEAYFGQGRRQRQVIVITAAFHGAEIESIAGVMNLIAVLESAKDLKGKDWPVISEHAPGLRIVIVPVANPDGRTRVPGDDQQQWHGDLMLRYRHGAWKDGTLIGHKGNRQWQPLPLDRVEFPGGYVNARGVEPKSGWKFGREMDPEVWAVADLVEAECADCVLDLHSCGSGPFLFAGNGFVPQAYHERQCYVDGALRAKFRARGLGAKPWRVRGSREETMHALDLFHQLSGCLPLCYEGPTGIQKGNEHSHEAIVDQYMTLFETVFEIGTLEGFRVPGAAGG